MSVRRIRIGDVLELRRDPVEVEPGERYRRIGIYSWGKGIIHHPPVDGADMGSMRYFTFAPHALILSNIQAWEAAVAVSSEKDSSDFVCSNRFLPYLPIGSVDVDYLKHYFLSEEGLAALRRASPGTQVRNRTLGKALFEAIEVPLPDLPEQRRIAAHLDAIAQTSSAASLASMAFVDASRALASRQWGGPEVRIGHLVQQVQRATPVEALTTYSLLGVRWYGHGLFIRERKAGKDIGARVLYEIRPGDLVYNRLFAWKQSFAVSSAVEPVHASGEFPSFRVNQDLVLPEFLLASLLTDRFTNAVNDASSGSTPTSRNRLKVDQFLELTVSLPDRPEQERVASMTRRLRLVAEARSRSEALSDVLLPAARNEVFSAMR